MGDIVDLYPSGDMPTRFELIRPEAPLAVLADPDPLRQLAIHLARNAQAAHEQGRPRIRIAVRPSQNHGREGVELLASEDGPALSDAMVVRLLEPYVTTKPRGSGLGLASVRRIVDDHGGTIAVSNGPDGGAVARIWLPAG